MKKIISWLLAGCFLLLCACGAQPLAEKESTPEAETSGEINATEPNTAEADVASSSNCFTIWEDENCALQFWLVKDYFSFTTNYLFRLINNTDSQITVEITSLVMNGCVADSEVLRISGEPGTNTQEFTKSAAQRLVLAGESRLCSLVGNFEITEGYGITIAADTFDVTIPEDILPEFLCEPCLDAFAEEQVLADNDNVKITLLGAGKYATSNTWDENDFCGIVSIENKNSDEIPVGITAVQVNGVTMEVSANPYNTLMPQETGTLQFSVSEYDLEQAGITSITSVSLTVLTSDTENSGYFSNVMEGGSNYPVILSKTGVLEENETYQPIPEDLVYEDDNFSVYAIGPEMDGYNSITWSLWVENRSNQTITFQRGEETLVDGTHSDDIYVDGEIGAGAGGFCEATKYELYPGYYPALSLQLVITSAGEDKLFAIIDKITFEEKPYELVADTGDVQVYYIGASVSNWGYAEWRFEACNASDIPVKISVEDVTLDSIYCASIRLENNDNGTADLLSVYLDDATEPIPEVSFRLVITNTETEEIIYTGDMITLSPSI